MRRMQNEVKQQAQHSMVKYNKISQVNDQINRGKQVGRHSPLTNSSETKSDIIPPSSKASKMNNPGTTQVGIAGKAQ